MQRIFVSFCNIVIKVSHFLDITHQLSFFFIPLVLSCCQRDVTVLSVHWCRWHGVFLEVAFSQHEVQVSDFFFCFNKDYTFLWK